MKETTKKREEKKKKKKKKRTKRRIIRKEAGEEEERRRGSLPYLSLPLGPHVHDNSAPRAAVQSNHTSHLEVAASPGRPRSNTDGAIAIDVDDGKEKRR